MHGLNAVPKLSWEYWPMQVHSGDPDMVAGGMAVLGIEATSETGYVALGFPTSPGQMIGATAVIATDKVDVYKLTGKSVAEVKVVTGAVGSQTGRRLSQGTFITDVRPTPPPHTQTSPSLLAFTRQFVALLTPPYSVEMYHCLVFVAMRNREGPSHDPYGLEQQNKSFQAHLCWVL
jgi:hypothetical protein